ncbi:SCO2400 family protein [Streptomyces sp. McG8]|uniref:SCO2400 family protein n=1 Tax=Streptomyces sp. McG8 TaxID=2725487 RepID=UPI0020368226
MDYCSTCRRHLNGALVCPGCGSYAPDIAPGVVGGHRIPGRAATASGTAGAARRAAAEGPAEGGWFTAPARSAGTTRADEPARPAGSAPRAETSRPGEIGHHADAARPDAPVRPVGSARSAGAMGPAGSTGPLDGARSADTTWPAGAGRPGQAPRPVGTGRSHEAPRPADTTATPAEGIRPVLPARRAETAVFAAPARHDATARHDETGGPAADTPRAAPPAGAGTGRAARRRQLARWKKTQRRALVATAVALVGGGITLASTERGGTDRTQASTAPDLHGMGGTAGTTDDAAGIPSVSPERTTAPPQADVRRTPARPEAAPTTTAPPSGTHTDGAAATEVPAGGRSDAPESVSRSGNRSEASQDTGGGAPSSGGSTTTTPSPS